MFYIHLSYIFTYVLWYSSSINWWLAFLKQRLKVYLDLVIFSISDSNDNLFPKFTILPKSIDPFRSSVFIWLFDGSDAVRYLLFLYFYTWEIQRMLNMLMYVSKIQIKVKIAAAFCFGLLLFFTLDFYFCFRVFYEPAGTTTLREYTK